MESLLAEDRLLLEAMLGAEDEPPTQLESDDLDWTNQPLMEAHPDIIAKPDQLFQSLFSDVSLDDLNEAADLPSSKWLCPENLGESLQPLSKEESFAQKSCDECQICDRPAGKHLYYGARVCLSCRAFFRRSCMNKRYQSFTCSSSKQDCIVSSTVKRVCSFCRYQQCLNAGMNPRWMMTDEERKVNLQKKKMLGKKEANLKSPFLVHGFLFKTPTPEFSMGEMLRIKELLESARKTYFSAMIDTLMNNFEAAKILYELNLCKETLPCPNAIRVLEHVEHEVFREFFHRFDEVTNAHIDREDLECLMANNFPIFFTTICATYFHPKDFKKHLTGLAKLLHERRDLIWRENYQHLVQGLRDFEMADKPPAIEYEKVYVSPWSSSAESEKRHRQLIQKIQAWPRESPDAPGDEVLGTIVFLIEALSTINVRLRDRAKVEEIQHSYIGLLYRYLKFSHGSRANSKLASGLMILADAKEAYDMHCSMLPVK